MKTTLKVLEINDDGFYLIVDEKGKEIADLSKKYGKKIIDVHEEDGNYFIGMYKNWSSMEFYVLFNRHGNVIVDGLLSWEYINDNEFICIAEWDDCEILQQDVKAIPYQQNSFVIDRFQEIVFGPTNKEIRYDEEDGYYTL